MAWTANRNVFSACLLVALTSAYVTEHGIREDAFFSGDGGSGLDDEDMSDFFTDFIVSDVTVLCYKCVGEDGLGCNVTLMNQDPERYVTQCTGHCLNITTENSTMFDCTENVAVTEDWCIEEAAKLCACGTDLCNGPPRHVADAIELPSSQDEIIITSHRHNDVMLADPSEPREDNDASVHHTLQKDSMSGGHRQTVSGCFPLFLLFLWWV